MSDQKPSIAVSVTIAEQDGVFKAIYNPALPVIPDSGAVLRYTLDTDGWAFGAIRYGAPFSDLVTISPTEFQITDNGGPPKEVNSFNVKIVQAASASDTAAADIDSDPEVENGPHG